MQKVKMLGFLQALCSAAALAAVVFSCEAPPIPAFDGEVGFQKAAPEAQAKAGGGKIVFTQTSVDLGNVERGKEAVHTFVVKNGSGRVLNIKRVRGS